MSNRSEMASAMYPHLADRSTPHERPRQRNSLAERIYPGLAPKPPPPSNPWRDSLRQNLRDLTDRLRGR
jgi:hypothetical protein